ncbi:outer membrane lipoprotein-sorting protein [Thauera sinica]|nr:outer membrane lipoprotein-sorting protein [Thauera sp. K11]
MTMERIRKPVLGAAAALTLSAFAAQAAELPPGTVISAENIDKIKDDTFEGHKIGSLLTEKMEWRIRNNGWKLPLAKSKEVPLDPSWVKASQANAGKTKINAQTCQIDGWVAGQPFPDIDMKDPQAAEKIVWNWHLGQLLGDVAIVPYYTQVLIDGEKGVHADPVAEFTRYSMKGRLNGESTQGDGSERGRQLLYFKSPSDMKGLGTFTIQYDSAKVNDVWAYVPAVRRVRRLSGGAWMDPVGSSDQLQDDLDIFNARPCWYPGYKLLGKRHVLAVMHSKYPLWNTKGKSFEEKFPVLENKPPYWNMNNNSFEPREVYVIEATTPPEHPYSKKVIYVDTKFPRIHYGEAYNRKGEFWKFMEWHSYPGKGEDGFIDIRTAGGAVIDFQRNHATVSLIDTTTWKTNPAGVKESDVSLQTLQAAGR